jgi:hypothetical protein
VIESLEAAERLDCEEWTREQLMTVIRDESLIDRFVKGSRIHAARRIHEMKAATELLTEINVVPFMTDATVRRLKALKTR